MHDISGTATHTYLVCYHLSFSPCDNKKQHLSVEERGREGGGKEGEEREGGRREGGREKGGRERKEGREGGREGEKKRGEEGKREGRREIRRERNPLVGEDATSL